MSVVTNMNMFSAFDHAMMARALQLAERGRGIATPNPHVGCVIVKDGRIIGEGFTQSGGRPHAEAVALDACTQSPTGATAYSTLEPCALHATSRGPACADLLIAAKVARVVSALHDPFHGVDGKGHAQLQRAGITLDIGLMQAQAQVQLKAFLTRVTRGRPWVTLKVAASIDGKTALANGQSKWITSEAARRDVHRLRSEVCAVMTGIGTALADDPALTVRDVSDPSNIQRQPLRILLDSRLDIRDDMQLLKGGNTVIVTATGSEARAAELASQGIEILRVPTETAKGKTDLVATMRTLGAYQGRGLNHIMVETGAKLNASLIEAGVVDEIIFYLAPSLLGDNARGLFALPAFQNLEEKYSLNIRDVRHIGVDLRVTADVNQK
jgi:diaminohydroxyphosphoribosylaminopyrimidine deaminase / 5-amino-6-(5-phosphoribosylamino)uracil reductase